MLTRAQQRTLDFIREFFKKNQHSPTTAEVAKGIGIQSRGVVYRYLKALADENRIKLMPNRHRNIQLLNENNEYSIPLLGSIAAGHPIEAVADNEVVTVTDIFAGPHRYALRVKGDSMIDEGIWDGDLVVCEHATRAQNGQIVVALIDEQEATLKRIRYSNDQHTVTLIPANTNYQPMHFPADRIRVQGIYIGLVRLAH